jgi:TonB family protein
MVYAGEETPVKAVQQPRLKTSRSTSTTSSPLFGIKNPKVLELQRPVSKTDAPISLFQLPATVQRSSAPIETLTMFPLETERTGFGLFVKRQESQRQEPAIPEFEDSKETIQPDDTLEQIAVEGVEEEVFFEIEGPASRREVIYKPPYFPEVKIDMDVSIRLQFWILPDGTVGEVVPLQRGDLRLERAAIQYLKSWLFTPVSGEQEMWGVFPITYKLR